MKNIQELNQRILQFKDKSPSGFICIGRGISGSLACYFDIDDYDLYTYNGGNTRLTNGWAGTRECQEYYITEEYYEKNLPNTNSIMFKNTEELVARIKKHGGDHTPDFICIGKGNNSNPISGYFNICSTELHCDSDTWGPKNAQWSGANQNRLYFVKREYYNKYLAPLMTPKTYTESKGHKLFDWQGFLHMADVKRESVSLKDCDKARQLSANWLTCPCGNLTLEIERDNLGAPKDRELKELGEKFHKNLMDYNFAMADDTLFRIKSRAEKVLKEQKEKARKEEEALKEKAEVQEHIMALTKLGYIVTKPLCSL